MNRRRISSRRSASATLTPFVVIGVLLGVGFLFIDRWRNPPPPNITSTPATVPTNAPTLEPTTPALPTATPIVKANLIAPTAGINAQVVDVYMDGVSWDVNSLGEKVGHLEGTAWFGQQGNIALAGHVELRDGRPGIFARIDEVREGDPIILQLDKTEQHYSVTQIMRVAPDDLTPLYPTNEDKITLITCDQYDFLQNSYLERVVVVAVRVVNPA
ncbi:MAG: sortase [Anaerolineae bacterium]